MKRAGWRALRRSLVSASAAVGFAGGNVGRILRCEFCRRRAEARSRPEPPPGTRRPRSMPPAIHLSWPSLPTRRRPTTPQNKKAFDDYQAQAAKEPLAVKLADSVGHVRVATNFAWTLNTGYLVLFMQAGFRAAHLRAGSQEECRASDDAEFRGVCVRFPRVLRGRIRISVRRGRDQRRAHESRRHSHPEPFPDWQRAMGIRGRQRILLRRSRL